MPNSKPKEKFRAAKAVPSANYLVLKKGFGLLLAGLFATAVSARAASASKIEFNRDVLPILSQNCFACHGVDSASRKADLR
ncbi:MAG: hypothetical protein ABIQ35_06580, partial [Verrucomicrobiota bacterium]